MGEQRSGGAGEQGGIKKAQVFCLSLGVPWRGLEPPRPKGIGPQPTAYANSATRAVRLLL